MYIVNQDQKLDQLVKTGYSLGVGDLFSEGWELFRKAPGQYIIYTVIYLAIVGGLNIVLPIIGPLVGVVIGPVLLAGYFLGSRKLDETGNIEIGDFFKGFDHINQLAIFGVVNALLTFVSFTLLLLPGIWYSVAACMSVFFIIYTRSDFWQGIKNSIKLVNANWFGWFGFLILLGLFNLAGVIAFGIGILITIPTTFCIFHAAWKKLIGFGESQESDPADHLVNF